MFRTKIACPFCASVEIGFEEHEVIDQVVGDAVIGEANYLRDLAVTPCKHLVYVCGFESPTHPGESGLGGESNSVGWKTNQLDLDKKPRSLEWLEETLSDWTRGQLVPEDFASEVKVIDDAEFEGKWTVHALFALDVPAFLSRLKSIL
jgi:hypothetical protein